MDIFCDGRGGEVGGVVLRFCFVGEEGCGVRGEDW